MLMSCFLLPQTNVSSMWVCPFQSVEGLIKRLASEEQQAASNPNFSSFMAAGQPYRLWTCQPQQLHNCIGTDTHMCVHMQTDTLLLMVLFLWRILTNIASNSLPSTQSLNWSLKSAGPCSFSVHLPMDPTSVREKVMLLARTYNSLRHLCAYPVQSTFPMPHSFVAKLLTVLCGFDYLHSLFPCLEHFPQMSAQLSFISFKFLSAPQDSSLITI